MDKLDRLLEWVQKSNPGMTKDRLIEELGKCRYSANALVMIWQNSEKQAV